MRCAHIYIISTINHLTFEMSNLLFHCHAVLPYARHPILSYPIHNISHREHEPPKIVQLHKRKEIRTQSPQVGTQRTPVRRRPAGKIKNTSLLSIQRRKPRGFPDPSHPTENWAAQSCVRRGTKSREENNVGDPSNRHSEGKQRGNHVRRTATHSSPRQ